MAEFTADGTIPRGDLTQLAKNVLAISEAYAKSGPLRRSAWSNSDWEKAYLNYFLPLNWLRALSVIDVGLQDGFFNDYDTVIDFGSGPGTFHLAANERGLKFKNWHFVETERRAVEAHKKLLSYFAISTENCQWSAQHDEHKSLTHPKTKKILAVFSYALNEVSRLPSWALEADGLLIIEPSSREFGRRLQEIRGDLIDRGWHIWAPCTHALACPLLNQSEKDWCHSRIHIEKPNLLAEIENNLPMKNDTLTYSFLLACRERSNPITSEKKLARIIGDTLYERGKVRQAVCHGPKREFLSWLTRHGEPAPLQRGLRLEIPADAEIKGSEIRLPIKD